LPCLPTIAGLYQLADPVALKLDYHFPLLSAQRWNNDMRKEDDDLSTRERITLAGSDLVDYVKGLIEEGNIRRLIIRKPDGETLLEIPLSAGLAVGGVLTLMAPILAALGAMAALVAKVQVEVERRDDGEG